MVYEIKPQTTALLVIDAQEEYFSESGALYTPNAQTIKNNLVNLRTTAQQAGILVIRIEHVHRSSGIDIGRMGDFDETEVFVEGSFGTKTIEELADISLVIRKSRYSAFVGTELETILRGNGIDTLIVTGLMTQYCSVTTARHAHDLDYKVIFVSDANSGPDLPDMGWGAIDHKSALNSILTMLAVGVADIQSTNDILKQLQVR